jgi:hypothetical protein
LRLETAVINDIAVLFRQGLSYRRPRLDRQSARA